MAPSVIKKLKSPLKLFQGDGNHGKDSPDMSNPETPCPDDQKMAPYPDFEFSNGPPLPKEFFGSDAEGPSAEFTVADGVSPTMPPELSAGTLVDEVYAASPKLLNKLIWGPGSIFQEELRASLKTTDPHEGPWIATPGDSNSLAVRYYDYLTAPGKLMRGSRGVEYQRYVDVGEGHGGWGFYVLQIIQQCKGLPMGDHFTTETQICIWPLGPAPSQAGSSGGQLGCRLRISYEPHFLKMNPLKSPIEKAMHQGLMHTYAAYKEILSQFVSPLDRSALAAASSTSTGPMDVDSSGLQQLQTSDQGYQHGCGSTYSMLSEPVIKRPVGLVYGANKGNVLGDDAGG